MSWRRRFVNLFRRRRIEREIDEELSFHIEELTDSLIASGFSRTEARREALRRFGNYELKREHTREANTIQWIESLWRDLRFAARTYIRTPVFSGVVTAVLAITIAVSTAVFSIYSHLALQTVDGVQGANRLVSIGLAREANEWIPFSRDQYLFIAEALSVPETLIATSHSYQRIVEYGPSTHEAATVGVNPDYFSDLGVQFLLGTDLVFANANETTTNAVVSERFWRDELGAQPGVVGRTLTIADQPFTIVAVAGGGFEGLRRGAPEDIWIPLDAALNVGGPASSVAGGPAETMAPVMRRLTNALPVISLTARLPPGVGIDRLRRELDLISPRLRETSTAPQGLATERIRIEALPGAWADPRRHALLERQSRILFGGAVLVLLVATLNLASFMLARAPGRLGEFRTRLAIGASITAVVRQLFVEATLLVGIACSLGFVLHYWLRRALTQLSLFDGLPAVETDWRVSTFVIGVGLGVAVIAGLLPAVRIVNRPALSINARGSLGQRGQGLRPLLVLQISIGTLVVLAGALFVSEIWRLENAPLGFDPRNVVTARVMVPAQNDSAPESTTIPAEQMEQLGRDLLERISALPGVEGFAIASTVPIEVPLTNPTVVEIPGAEVQPAIDRRQVYENRVTPEFFAVLGARFAYGRPFDPLDSQQIVVSKTLAKHLWGREDVVGEDVMLAETQLMTFGQNLLVTRGADADRARPRFTVVGVVEDIRYSVAEGDYQPLLYRASSSGALGGRHYVVRTSLDPAVLMGVADGLVRERVQSMAADIPVLLRDSLYESLSGERARSRLALGAAVVALLLTIAGLYTSMQHAVDARRGELALRKAMGATDGRLARMILTQATTVVAAGSAMAFLAAVLFAERLRDLVLGLDPFSPFAWAVTLALIGITGIGAACWPAMRAASVEPASALHYE